MRALVLGYGRSGKAAEALLKAQGVESVVLADDERDRIKGEGFDFAVVSPGIALTHPWIVEAKRRGIPLKSELQLGCEELKRQGWKLLAVTGSKGKSSVVKVVADAINLAGMRAVACGNYGTPVCEVAVEDLRRETGDGAERWAVVEVSSFMMETTDLPADTFEAAAILNLQEDHLDRHGSVEVYHGLKRKLLTMAKVPLDFSKEKSRFDLWKHGKDKGSLYYLDSYFHNEILVVNGEAAYQLMREVRPELGIEALRRAFREFEPLPHRMSLVAEIGGVRYIDDSKATSLAALEAGVKMAGRGPLGLRRLLVRFGLPSWRRRVRLVAGGLPKGDDPKTVLSTLTERVKKVYLIGQSAEAFCAAWQGAVDCEICGTMERAVEKARREAEKGETVLLSPGTASFDQFKSYGERGDVFARLVKGKGQPK